jgi:signal transduction histidine kinase
MRLCLLLGLLLCCSSVFAGLPETPQFRQVTVADGLPSSTLYAVTQDKKGYLWIASKDGLARYDGVSYKIYRYEPGNENALPGNVIQALYVDPQDRLWIAIEGQGISRLSADRRSFTHFRKSSHPEMGSDDVWAMTMTADGALWFGTYNGGLHRMDADGKIKRFVSDKSNINSLPSNTVLSLAVDEHNRLWIGTTKGLCFWDGKDFKSMQVGEIFTGFIMQLLADRDGSLWVGTNKGLVHLSDIGSPIGQIFLAGKRITALWQDHHGALWISDGPNVFQWHDGHLSTYMPDHKTPAEIYGIFEDHEEGLWFPTTDRGLLRLSAGWRNFSTFRHDADDVKTLSGNLVYSASEADDNVVWLVSGDSLDRINLIQGSVERVLENTENWTTQVWSVLQSRNGSVWLGHSKGLTRFEPRTGLLKHFSNEEQISEALPGAIHLLIQTNDGLIWSSSYGGGIEARDDSGLLVHRIVPADNKGLNSTEPDQFVLSPDSDLWISTAEGLLRWMDKEQKFTVIAGSPAERVDAFCFLSKGIVWVHHNTVLEEFQWDGKELKSLHRVTSGDGLPSLEVGSILPGSNGNLWLTTPRGLLRYNTLTNQFRMFGERDGLPSQEFDMQPGLLTSEGLALVGTSKGLVIFDPARISSQSNLSPLVIDEISARRGEDKIKFLENSTILDLQPNDRDLRVSLRFLSFDDATTHRYHFLLKGYDPGWVDVGAQGERIFSSLPSGSYELLVKATNAEGRWSAPLKFNVTVHPPWWKTAWANMLWVLLFCVAVISLALFYRNRLAIRNEQELRDQERVLAQQNSSAKSRFLATLGHEIRTPMTGLMGMADLLQSGELSLQQRQRVTSIQGAGQHLLQLVNDVLDLAQIEAGKLRLHADVFNLEMLVLEVCDLLRPLAEIKGLSFDCIIEKNAPGFCIGDAGRVRQILLNLGNNAIKFTERGSVVIKTSGLSPHGLQFHVSDTGPGMSNDQQARLFQRFEQAEGHLTSQRYGGSGLGLAICQELAEAMNGHIQVESSLGHGAVFVVQLPLQNSDAAAPSIFSRSSPASQSMPMSILLVEDDTLVADVLCEILQRLGHRVAHVHQGMLALSELAVRDFDLALIDLDLPGIDGLELARLIFIDGHSLPLVALTARTDTQAESAAIAAGMKAFIRKPVSSSDLEALIQTFMPTIRLE